MLLTRVHPASSVDGPATVDVDDAASRSVLRDWYAPTGLACVRVNLIGSITGSAGGDDGSSHSLSDPVDRRILGVIRQHADVVLIGAESVRREGDLMPRSRPLAIATISGDLSGHRIDPAIEPGRVIVLCAEEGVAEAERTLGGVRAEIVALAAHDGRIEPAALLTALQVRGHESIVCEGGPSLAAQLLDAGLVDELCLTTAAVVGGSGPSLGTSTPRGTSRMTLEHLLVDESGSVYARWARATDATTAAPRASD